MSHLISLQQACLNFGDKCLLSSSNFFLHPGEHVALLGRNGTGKSTLLRLLAGDERPDSGQVWRKPALRCHYLAQTPPLPSAQSIQHYLAQSHPQAYQAHQNLENIGAQLKQTPEDPQLLQTLQESQQILDDCHGWDLFQRAEAAYQRFELKTLNLHPPQRLSGGQQKRLALAQAWMSQADLLILDEPTNHLDLIAIAQLQQWLQSYPGAIIFTSHNRAFLEAVAHRIVELDQGQLFEYPTSNLQRYDQLCQQRLEAQQAQQQQLNKHLAQEELWLHQGITARRKRNEGRVRRLLALRQQLAQSSAPKRMQMQAAQATHSANITWEITDLCKQFGTTICIDQFSCRLLKGEKLGLIGPNGCGKSTFLKLLVGDLLPDQGTIRQGNRLEIAYFDQQRQALDPTQNVIENVAQGREFIEINRQQQHIHAYLENFLFSSKHSRTPVGHLSGGEQNRVLLARLFSYPSNVLILDEPTNDLDLETLELLENLIVDYVGTVFVVSHDQRFLDNLCTKVLVWEGYLRPGQWRLYAGGFSDWLTQSQQTLEQLSLLLRPEQKSTPKSSTIGVSAPKPPALLSSAERRELQSLPEKIEQLEQKYQQQCHSMAQPTFYQQNKIQVLLQQRQCQETEKLLQQALARWEWLEIKLNPPEN